jgi:hypothetical protein
VPCPNDPRNLWQFFYKIEKIERKFQWSSECSYCGHWQMYRDFTPCKILEHFGFRSTRETAAKFKACQCRGTGGHKDVAAHPWHGVRCEVCHELGKAQGSRTQQVAVEELLPTAA